MFAIRVPFAIVAGALFSTAIFLALAQLVSVPFDIAPPEEAVRIEFTRQRPDTPVEPVRPTRPERELPKIDVIGPRGPTVIVDDFSRDSLPRTELARPPKTGLPVGTDRDIVPFVRVNPLYPPRELARGTEGWVHVQFTVTATGSVRDATVIASEPGSVFDEAALDAITRWRYNPRVENGVAVERVGLQTIIRFELENSRESTR